MDRQLVDSAYAPEAAPQIATDDLASSAANFSVADGSTPFEELMDLKRYCPVPANSNESVNNHGKRRK